MNVVLSPFVVSGALSLAAAGATPGGAAETELLTSLNLKTHSDFAALSAKVLASEGVSISGANGVFTHKSIKPDYVSLVQSVHSAFAAPLGSSFKPINEWVSAKTDGHINNLLTDPVDPLIRAVLVSAVFFKGSWRKKFEVASTTDSTFTAVDGSTRQAQIMRTRGSYAASAGIDSLAGAAAVRLDYGPGEEPAEFCALLVLPAEPGAPALMATIRALADAASAPPALGGVLDQLRSQTVLLALPRVKAAYGTESLKPALRSLGIAEAFDGSGGFGAMSDDPDVHITDVVTKAVLEMDEEGTTAAAAAAVIMKTRSIPRPPLQLTFDRPFVMAVVHVPTGAPIFAARINEPGAGQ